MVLKSGAKFFFFYFHPQGLRESARSKCLSVVLISPESQALLFVIDSWWGGVCVCVEVLWDVLLTPLLFDYSVIRLILKIRKTSPRACRLSTQKDQMGAVSYSHHLTASTTGTEALVADYQTLSAQSANAHEMVYYVPGENVQSWYLTSWLWPCRSPRRKQHIRDFGAIKITCTSGEQRVAAWSWMLGRLLKCYINTRQWQCLLQEVTACLWPSWRWMQIKTNSFTIMVHIGLIGLFFYAKLFIMYWFLSFYTV